MRARAILATAALAMLARPAAAADDAWSVEGTVASEYLSKGVGRSDGEPHAALQVQRAIGERAYAGLWSGTLRSPLGADAETHLYLGWRPQAGAWSFDVRPMLKVLSGAQANTQSEQVELRLDAARPLVGARLRLRLEQTLDGYGASEGSTWMEANLSRRLGGSGWTVSGALGRREQEIGRDYTAWSLGLQRRLTDGVSADLRWVDTDQDDAGREYRSRLVLGLTASLR